MVQIQWILQPKELLLSANKILITKKHLINDTTFYPKVYWTNEFQLEIYFYLYEENVILLWKLKPIHYDIFVKISNPIISA